MNTYLFSHSACLGHDPGPQHPENSGRIRVIEASLEAEEFMLLDRREAPRATFEQLSRVHTRDHIDRVLGSAPRSGHLSLDADTIISQGSPEAALRAAGAACAAVDVVLAAPEAGAAGGRNAFCAVRPPGHHAERDRVMGFCLFNNAAIAAAHARTAHGLRRVAVVDFDVHHGNGTQEIFWDKPGLFYASLHEAPLYPGTGAREERGGSENILNIPLSAGATGVDAMKAIEREILPALAHFKPELLILSAGFDAHLRDPLANLAFSDADFNAITTVFVDAAGVLCQGRLVSVLEGGYDPDALAASAAAHVRALMTA